MAVCVPHLVREVRRQLWELVRSFYWESHLCDQASGFRQAPLPSELSHQP